MAACSGFPLVSNAHPADPTHSSVLPMLLWVLCPAWCFQQGLPFGICHSKPSFSYHWVIFTACTESCSPLGSSHSIRLLLPPAGEAAGCQSSGMLSLGSLAEGLGGSGTAAGWHRVSRLWVLAGSGDSVPLGFLPWLLQGLCGRRAACQGQVVPGSLGHL